MGKSKFNREVGNQGYGLDIDIEVSRISSRQDIVDWVSKHSELKGLGKGAKEEVIKNMWKAFKYLTQ